MRLAPLAHDLAHGGIAHRRPKGVYVPALAPRQRHTGLTAASTQEVVAALRELLKPPEPRGTPMAVTGSNAAFLGVEPTK